MPSLKLVGFVGSLRASSINRMLMNALVELAPQAGLEIAVLEIGDVPHFNADLEAAMPAPAAALKKAVSESDGVVFVTPEYNRAMPGVLKNALDWLSRPYGQNSLAGKPVLVTGATSGGIGTSLAQYQLKQVLLYLDAHLMGQPELHIGGADKRFTEGKLTDEKTEQFLLDALQKFATHARRFKA